MGVVVYYFTIVVSSALFCIGLVVFLKRPFFNLAASSTSQLNVILDNSLKDEEKDSLIFQNLRKVIGSLLLCLVLLCLLIFLAGLLPVLCVMLSGRKEIDTSSVYFYSSITAGSFSLLFLKNKGNYSYWSKLLHTIILDNYSIEKYFLQREFRKYSKAEPAIDQDFLIVTGLARAGTTALTNLIYSEEKFHSIKYSNVPFLLSPNTWKKVYNPKKVSVKERAHNDNVFFSETSIEALEEHFFKVNLNDSYIKSKHLEKHVISTGLLRDYYRYQNLFNESGSCYLAKNNNFILRYESIRKLNSNFKVLLVFRNPLDHAQSLLNQHRNFLEQQKEDGFVLKYMDWLGHHEFGLNHKHFDLFKNNFCPDDSNKNDLSFWLQVWINYYSYVNEIYSPTERLFLIHYDDLVKNPAGLKNKIGLVIEKELMVKNIKPFELKKIMDRNCINLNDKHFKRAEEIYQKLILNKLVID